jgi:acetyl esterase/lipase
MTKAGICPPLDSELAAALTVIQRDLQVSVTPELIEQFRASADRVAPTLGELSRGGSVHVSERQVVGHGGAPISMLTLRPGGLFGHAPCIYHLHGGGMIMGNRRTGVDVPLQWAIEFGAVVVSLEYRLAPEFPDPVPVEDAYAGLVWTHRNADELGINPGCLLVAGASAGGGLGAGIAMMSRDRLGPPIVGLALMCPMIDDRTGLPGSGPAAGELVWDRVSNDTGWNALLGDRRKGPGVSPYAAPTRATDLTNLPPVYIDVGSAEIFRDEGLEFASRLWRAGGQAELHVWPGGFHAFDTIVPQAALSVLSTRTRRSWVERMLSAHRL